MGISDTLASMIAQAKPRQAPAPGRTPISPGMGMQEMKSYQANIPVSRIASLFGVGPEAQKERDALMQKMFQMYTEQGATDDPVVLDRREREMRNPVVQKLMAEAHEKGSPYIEQDWEESYDKEDFYKGKTTTQVEGMEGGEKTADYYKRLKPVYRWKQIAPTEQAQKEAILRRMPYEEKRGRALPTATGEKILAGEYGEEARKKLLGARAYLTRSGRIGIGSSKRSETARALEQAHKAYQQSYLQASKNLDPLTAPDDEATNYKPLTQLGGAVLKLANTSVRLTGKGDEARGAIESWVTNVDKEMAKPSAEDREDLLIQRARRSQYVDLYIKMLKMAPPTSYDPYVKLMQWEFDSRGGSAGVQDFRKNFRFSSDPKENERIIKEIWTRALAEQQKY